MRLLFLLVVLSLSGCATSDRSFRSQMNGLAIALDHKGMHEAKVLEARTNDEVWVENMLIIMFLGQQREENLLPRTVDEEF